MKLSRAAEYALLALCCLAQEGPHACVPTHRLAAIGRMPEKFLSEILRRLVKAGILLSLRGPDGGYRLVPDVEDISLLAVIEAADGPLADVRASKSRGSPGGSLRGRATAPLTVVTDGLRGCLKSMTVGDLLDSAAATETPAASPGEPQSPFHQR